MTLKNRTICSGISPLQIPESLNLNADIISVSDRNDFACMSNFSDSGTVKCFGDNTQGQLDFDSEFKTGVEIITTGQTFTCMSKQGLAKCFGSNGNIKYNVPSAFESGVEVMASGWRHVCASTSGSAQCWGICSPVEDVGHKCTVPSVFTSGADVIAAGQEHTCMGKTNIVKCFGNNT